MRRYLIIVWISLLSAFATGCGGGGDEQTIDNNQCAVEGRPAPCPVTR